MIKYILISILAIFLIFFGYMFLERKKELPKVQETVREFMKEVNEGNKTEYEKRLHSNFIGIFDELYQKYPVNFTNISSIDDGTGLYSKSTSTGTTFEYETFINYSQGEVTRAPLTIKLIKKEDVWLIYGIYFGLAE